MKNEHDANMALQPKQGTIWMQPSKARQNYTPAKQGPGVNMSGVLIGLILSAPFLAQIIVDFFKG